MVPFSSSHHHPEPAQEQDLKIPKFPNPKSEGFSNSLRTYNFQFRIIGEQTQTVPANSTWGDFVSSANSPSCQFYGEQLMLLVGAHPMDIIHVPRRPCYNWEDD